jgi:hypothetical protein
LPFSQVNETLTKLDISENIIGDKGAGSIADALKVQAIYATR